MNNQQSRVLLFAVLSFVIWFGSIFLMEKTGLVKPAARPVAKKKDIPKAKAKEQEQEQGPEKEKAQGTELAEAPKEGEAPKRSMVNQVDPTRLVLGVESEGPGAGDLLPTSPHPNGERLPDPKRFWLRIGLDQRGGAVAWAESMYIEAEHSARGVRPGRFQFIRPGSSETSSLTMGFARPKPEGGKPNPEEALPDVRLWDVEPAADGSFIHILPVVDGKNGAGQEVRFLAKLDDGVTLRRRYQLWPGEESIRMVLEFQADEDRTFAYRMLGPHNIPIEGIWYTGTFRDVFVGQASGEDGASVTTKTAYDVVKNEKDPWRFLETPVRFGGVEDQYFALFWLTPSRADSESQLAGTVSTVVKRDKDTQHSDVTFDVLSKPLSIGPNRSETHEYTIFAGPKTVRALPPVARDLASYRKGSWPLIGGLAVFLAQNVITPMLAKIYQGTSAIASIFGGARGNWGIAIILLTMTVRLLMFPISRKQAISAKRMQDLQPEINALREKYKDDKERIGKETFALYGKHKVNPFAGCWPALVQLPIFIGLWQALNNSVALRHARFLWIEDLAAPDMLFKFPFNMQDVPWIGGFLGPYFNILPILVAALMYLHTKLFAPPATTPEAETQQKMMKYMMFMMVFMFYKVPSGLGIYFITSSLWQLGERLLLPKVLPSTLKKVDKAKGGEESGGGDEGGGGGGGGNGPVGGGWFAQKLEKLLEEAAKDPTVRNRMEALEQARPEPTGRGEKGPPDRGGRKPRARPGKKR